MPFLEQLSFYEDGLRNKKGLQAAVNIIIKKYFFFPKMKTSGTSCLTEIVQVSSISLQMCQNNWNKKIFRKVVLLVSTDMVKASNTNFLACWVMVSSYYMTMLGYILLSKLKNCYKSLSRKSGATYFHTAQIYYPVRQPIFLFFLPKF